MESRKRPILKANKPSQKLKLLKMESLRVVKRSKKLRNWINLRRKKVPRATRKKKHQSSKMRTFSCKLTKKSCKIASKKLILKL